MALEYVLTEKGCKVGLVMAYPTHGNQAHPPPRDPLVLPKLIGDVSTGQVVGRRDTQVACARNRSRLLPDWFL